MGAIDAVRHADLPLLTLEMRRKHRGARPFAVMFFYALVLSAIAVGGVYFFAGKETWLSGRGHPDDLSKVGQGIFWAISIVQWGMIALMMPAFTARAITSEREEKTLEMLALTSLGSHSIVYQKLLVAVLQVGMLVLASLPILAVTFLIGGVSPLEILISYLVLLAEAVFYGSLSMMCSAICTSSRSAIFVAYLMILFVLPTVLQFGGVLVGMVFAALMIPMAHGSMAWLTGILAAMGVVVGAGLILLFNYISARRLHAMRRVY